jgi:hypothetical protein
LDIPEVMIVEDELKVKERIALAQKNDRVKRFDYLEMTRGIGLTAMYCKTCGGPVKSMKVLKDLPNREGAQREAVALGENANYTEIEILFDDGSKHQTMICIPCTKKITKEDLEDIYCADMEQLRREALQGNEKVRWDLFANRKPLSFERIK